MLEEGTLKEKKKNKKEDRPKKKSRKKRVSEDPSRPGHVGKGRRDNAF